jgi:hypothetical protein
MSSIQVVEQLFQMCHEFKECKCPEDPQAIQPCCNSEHSAAKVAELIQKLKGQVEPPQH